MTVNQSVILSTQILYLYLHSTTGDTAGQISVVGESESVKFCLRRFQSPAGRGGGAGTHISGKSDFSSVHIYSD